MAYADVLAGLTAMILEGREAPDRATLLARRAPGLTSAERATLLAVPAERMDVYAGLVRDNQGTMLRFVAPLLVEVAARFADVAPGELARATLVDAPRTSSSLRELAARVVEYLSGPGRAIVTRCPPALDLARLEQAVTEAFYAVDDAGALAPADFAARLRDATVEEVLRLEARPPSASRTVTLAFDVLAWRDRRWADGAWAPPPAASDTPLSVLVVRDPATLQATCHRLPPPLLAWLTATSAAAWTPLEAWAERWVVATGTAADDAGAAARFFEQVATFVAAGILAVREPTA